MRILKRTITEQTSLERDAFLARTLLWHNQELLRYLVEVIMKLQISVAFVLVAALAASCNKSKSSGHFPAPVKNENGPGPTQVKVDPPTEGPRQSEVTLPRNSGENPPAQVQLEKQSTLQDPSAKSQTQTEQGAKSTQKNGSESKVGHQDAIPVGTEIENLERSKLITECRAGSVESLQKLGAKGSFAKAERTDYVDLIDSLRRKHAFINPLDTCRQDLNLRIIPGSQMTASELYNLNACTERNKADATSDSSVRTAALQEIHYTSGMFLCNLSTQALDDGNLGAQLKFNLVQSKFDLELPVQAK